MGSYRPLLAECVQTANMLCKMDEGGGRRFHVFSIRHEQIMKIELSRKYMKMAGIGSKATQLLLRLTSQQQGIPMFHSTGLRNLIAAREYASKSSIFPAKNGQEYYQLAKDHLRSHEEQQTLQEETNREEQYQKPGIAVVKTIVKQTRQKQNDESKPQSSRTADHLQKAQECMQIAAFVHGHNDAIVSLANHALSKKSFTSISEEYKYVHDMDTVICMEELDSAGSGVEVAEKLYKLASEKGSKEAWFNLGHLYWTEIHSCDGHKGVQVDESSQQSVETALQCFEKAVELDDDDARYFLAVHYLSQEDDNRSRRRGLALVQQAGDNGHMCALYYLALLYRNGDEGLSIKPCLDLFQEYLNQSADGGDGDALFTRAHCLFHGDDGFELDYDAALKGFFEAGEAGNADGFVSAGAMYHHGRFGIKQDQRRAFELYQEAGELGSIEGWRNVVACYTFGEGVPKCEQTAKYIAKTMLGKSR